MENRGGKDDEVSRRVWKAVETGAGEVRMGETRGRRSKRGSRKEERRKGEEGENCRNKESSRGVGDME